jgi:hypothetical protein
MDDIEALDVVRVVLLFRAYLMLDMTLLALVDDANSGLGYWRHCLRCFRGNASYTATV